MLKNISIEKDSYLMFKVFALLTLLSIFGGIISEFYVLAGLPFFLLLVYVTIVDFRQIYFLLLLFIPLSVEVTLPNGFGTDLPTEPLIVGLMVVYLAYLLKNLKTTSLEFIKHPIILTLMAHWLWILFTSITSNMPFISFKFFLAKSWYIIVFLFLTGHIIKSEVEIKKLFWWIFLPFIFAVMVVLTRHYVEYGMSFSEVNKVMGPFFRNHVSYAAILAVFFPFLWFSPKWYPNHFKIRWFLYLAIPIFLMAIQFSYTRTAYIALFIAGGAYFAIRFKLTRFVLIAALVGAIAGGFYLTNNNKYLDYAPNYEKTITHKNFDNLLEATYKFEDISTMERVYRWVAGFQMMQEELWTGFGPGNFYTFYRGYTVFSFETYVSDNPEQSGVHNYYLMTLVEQGLPGLIIFLILVAMILLHGERIYHESATAEDKRLVMMFLLSAIIIFAFIIINDMLETDKVGSFFFINIAVLVNLDLRNKRKKAANVITTFS